MTRRHPLQALRRLTEFESDRLRARLAQLDADLAACDTELDGARARLAEGLNDANTSSREGTHLSTGTLMLHRAHAGRLQAVQHGLQTRREALAQERETVAQAMLTAMQTLQAVDTHHDSLDQRAARDMARRDQAGLDELWAGRSAVGGT